MELKDYQNDVLCDLEAYLETLTEQQGKLPITFSSYWRNRGVFNQTYKNNVKGVPHICAKVPTAGGKTFIAVNAIEKIFNAFAQYNPTRPKFVIWLVPSLTILEQTVKNLSDIEHPYRQRLNELFNGRVQIYEKTDVLQGAGFNADAVKAQLSIVVMSFDSLKTKATNKENRKAFQENGYLASFVNGADETVEPLQGTDPSALINVIRSLKPLLVVDESHNAESALSVEMLTNVNPSFIFDLTATPRDNSNIISYVDAMRLKKQNMVKLPVIVANQRSQEDVIMAALKMRKQLEEYAAQEEENGGSYIRPIVLFQAEPKNKDDTTTFEKVKQTLIDLKIPPEHIAIKTANINELKDVDLMSPKCVVRYIITVNALKEGWDCPFAYILATLANKSSVVDVTQILGRVLRMPYVRKHKIDFLNLSYVFTASSNFQNTLSSVVKGLNKAGFSEKDYREFEVNPEAPSPIALDKTGLQADLLPENTVAEDELNPQKLDTNWEEKAVAAIQNESNVSGVSGELPNDELTAIKAQAQAQSQAYEEQAQNSTGEDCPMELKADMNTHKMKPNLKASANAIKVPQFFIRVNVEGGFFEESQKWQILSRENLLTDFELKNLDSNIDFDSVDSEIYAVDAKDIGEGESSIEFKAVKKIQKEQLNAIIRSQSDSGQIKSMVNILFDLLGKNTFYPIDDNDVKAYLRRIVEAMNEEQRADCLDKDYVYKTKIKDKINSLANAHGAKNFTLWLSTKKIELQPSFDFLPCISPNENAPEITKSLYVKEGKVNDLESSVISAVANLENVVWWHRNLERGKGFVINGFLNHYPDFAVLTEKKSIVIIETKGDDRDNGDSEDKLKLGKAWENQANQISHRTGYRYHYMMVFKSNPIEGALTHGEALKLVKDL
jgi:type III restriction enzyme